MSADLREKLEAGLRSEVHVPVAVAAYLRHEGAYVIPGSLVDEIRDLLASHEEREGEWSGPYAQGEPWIGVDLDGTLARYDGWVSPSHIGPPIYSMVERVRRWLDDGERVAIVTARVSVPEQAAEARSAIESWCVKHLHRVLPITHQKDYGMVECWDDRAVQVRKNEGTPLRSHTDREPDGEQGYVVPIGQDDCRYFHRTAGVSEIPEWGVPATLYIGPPVQPEEES